MENLPDNFDRNSLQFDSSRNVAPSTREHLARKTSGGDTVSDISHQEPLKQDPGIVSACFEKNSLLRSCLLRLKTGIIKRVSDIIPVNQR